LLLEVLQYALGILQFYRSDLQFYKKMQFARIRLIIT
jgi:hypothetical protein